jgi:hypothetical protein
VIETGKVFAGFLAGRALRLVREWLGEHTAELVANWDRARAQQPTEPWLRITFSDGAVKDVDVGDILARGGVFEPIRERRELFEQVRVNPETQRIEWPGEVDLDPEVLYGRFEPASGARIRRRTVREPTATRA